MNIQTGLFLLFSFTIEYIIFLFYGFSFLDQKTTCVKTFLISFISYMGMFLLSLIDNPIVNTLSYVALNIALFLFLFNSTWLSAILHTLILTFMMDITEFLTLLLLQRYTIDYYNELYTLQNRIFFAIISKLMFFTLAFFVSRSFGVQARSYNIIKRIPIRVFFVPFVSLFLILLVLAIWTKDYSLINNLPTGLFIPVITILILLLNILIYWDEFNRIKRTSENHTLQLQLQRESDMNEYYKSLIHESELRSTLIHDIKNHLYSIKALLASGNNESLDSYINNLLGSPALYQTIKRSDNEMLNAILSRYSDICRKKCISFDTDIRYNTINFLSAEDLTTLFCNMLDNAIDAIDACNSPNDSFIDLIIEPRNNNTFTIIQLSNTYNGEPIATDSSGMPKTSKQQSKNHGFGMKSMLSVIHKHEGDMHFAAYSNERIYVLTVLLKSPV